MTAYYNEFDPYAAEWLRNLIREGLIAPGDVDERSIRDVQPDDLRGYTQCHFFAGVGGWSLALRMAGWPDDRPVWTGSCPCQPFSSAGRGEGERDERHLWPEMRRLVSERRPPVVFGEQVASRLGRGWLSGVRADLEALGYAVGAADLCAAGVGAPHIRQRLWWVADADRLRLEPASGPRYAGEERHAERCGRLGHTDEPRRYGGARARSDGRRFSQLAHDGGVADNQAERRGEVDPQRGGRVEGSGAEGGERPEHGGGVGGLGNSECEGSQGRGSPQRNGERSSRQIVARVLSGRLADAGCERRDGEHARLRAENGRREPAGALPEAAGRGEHGGWDSAVWLSCADGKARRIEPGLEPLAHGIPNRVGRLRAYGNAIVPEVAEAFIRAYLESA